MAEDPLDLLQCMFPSIDGDVIAIVYIESDKVVDATVEKLLQLNESILPIHKDFPSLPSPLQYAAAARSAQYHPNQTARSLSSRQQPPPQHQQQSHAKWAHQQQQQQQQQRQKQQQQQQQRVIALQHGVPNTTPYPSNQSTQLEDFHQNPHSTLPWSHPPVPNPTASPRPNNFYRRVPSNVGSTHAGLNLSPNPYYQPFYRSHPGEPGSSGYVYGGVGVGDQNPSLYTSWMAPPPPIAVPATHTEPYVMSKFHQPSVIGYPPPPVKKQQPVVPILHSKDQIPTLKTMNSNGNSVRDEWPIQFSSGNNVQSAVSTKNVESVSSNLVAPGRTQSEPNFSRPNHHETKHAKVHQAKVSSGNRTVSITEGTTSKKLIILRGLPGSGKTTLARTLVGEDGVICSTDDFFYVDGQYVFDPSKLSEFHEKNRTKARGAMEVGKSPVIIDNTNTNTWEMKPYIHLALNTGYGVDILEADTPWRFKSAELARRNIHGVSKQKIERMLEKYNHQVSMEGILNSHPPHEKPPATTDHDKSTSSKPSFREPQGRSVDNHSEHSDRRDHSRLKGGSNGHTDRKKPSPATATTHHSRTVKESSSVTSSNKPMNKESRGVGKDNVEPHKRKSADDSDRPNNKGNHRLQQQVGSKKKKKTQPLSPRLNKKRPSSPHRGGDGDEKEGEKVNNGKRGQIKNRIDSEKREQDMEKSDLCDVQWDSSEELELFDSVEPLDQVTTNPPIQVVISPQTDSVNDQGLSGPVDTVMKNSTEGRTTWAAIGSGGHHLETTNAHPSVDYTHTSVQQRTWERTQSAHVLYSVASTGTYDAGNMNVLTVDAMRRTHSAQTFQELKPVVEEDHDVLDSTNDVLSSSVWGSGSGILLSEKQPRVESGIMSTSGLWSADINAESSWPGLISSEINGRSLYSLSSEHTLLTPLSVHDGAFTSTQSGRGAKFVKHEQNPLGVSNVKNGAVPLNAQEGTQIPHPLERWNHKNQQKSSGHLFPSNVWASSSGIFSDSDLSLQPATESRSMFTGNCDDSSPVQPPPSLTTDKPSEVYIRNECSHRDGPDRNREVSKKTRSRGNAFDAAIQSTQSVHSLEEAMQDESKSPLEHQSELSKELAKSTASASHIERFDGGLQSLREEFDNPFQTDHDYRTKQQTELTKMSVGDVCQSVRPNGGAVQSSNISSLTDDLLQSLASEMSDSHQLLSTLAQSSANGNLLTVIQSSLKSFIAQNKNSSALTESPVSTFPCSEASTALPHNQSNSSLFDDPAIVTRIPIPVSSGITDSTDVWTHRLESSSATTFSAPGYTSTSMSGYPTVNPLTTTAICESQSMATSQLQVVQAEIDTNSQLVSSNTAEVTIGASLTMPNTVGSSSSSELYLNGLPLDDVSTPGSSEVAQFVFPSAFPSVSDSLSNELSHKPDDNDPQISPSDAVFSPSSVQDDVPDDISTPPQSLTPVNDAPATEGYDDPGIVFTIEGNKESDQRTEAKNSPPIKLSTGQSDGYHTLESDPSLLVTPSDFKAKSESMMPTAEVNVASESDLMFLIGCFPHLEPSYLNRILQKCSGNVEDAVSIALVSATVPDRDLFSLTTPTCADVTYSADETCSSISSASDHLLSTSAEYPEDSNVPSLSALALAHVSVSQSPEGKMGVSFSPHREDDSECANDEEIARALQEQMNMEEKSLSVSESEAVGVQNDRGRVESAVCGDDGVHSDDNLELKLTTSLARQLQALFGPVDQYLPFQDQMRDDDLIILLSERAAKEIYKKWVDTLKAKKVGYQVQTELVMKQEATAPLDSSNVSSKRKRKKRHQTVPLDLLAPGNPPATRCTLPSLEERFSTIVERSSDSGHHIGKNPGTQLESQSNMTFRQQVKQLHSMFPQFEQQVINKTLVDNKFDVQSTVEVLANLVGLNSPDGNILPTAISRSVTAPSHMSSLDNHQPVPMSKQLRKLKRYDEDAPYQTLEDQPSYNDLRAEAALHAKLRAENFQKAAHARSKKLYEVASYYARQGHLHTEKMKEANRRAAGNIIHIQNEQGSNNLDLHGLHVEEALEALEEKLITAKKGKQSYLYVITGRGIHSKRREARIKPAVLNLLNSHGYKYEEMNAGRLQVKIK